MKSAKNPFLHPRSTVFRLISSFFILLLPFLILGLLFLSWSRAHMKTEIEASAQASVQYMSQNFKEKVDDLNSLLYQMTFGSSITEFAYNQDNLSTSDYYIALWEQYSLLREYQSVYPLIEDIVVYYPSSLTTLSTSANLQTKQEKRIQEILDSIYTTPGLIRGYEDKLFLTSIYPVSALYTHNMPRFFMTMELSYKTIEEYLDTSSKNYSTALYIPVHDKTVYSSSAQETAQYASYIEKIRQLIQDEPNKTTFSLSDSQYYVVAEYAPDLHCAFLQFIPLKEVFRVPDKIGQFLLIYSLLSLPIICIFCIIVNRLIVRPIERLMDGYARVESGDYATTLSEDTSSLEFKLMLRSFNNMTSHLNQAIDQVYNYRIFTQKMELKQLQMQINPHFLYNTYFILHRLIKYENIEQATQLSSYLGHYFQYITRSANDMVALKQEWEHAENYLKIQEIRFSMRIQIHYDTLPARYETFMVPKLILQPLLENALEHGMKEIQENGIVEVRFIECINHIEIQVKDNGNSLKPEDIGDLEARIHSSNSAGKEFTALNNIHRRLTLIYGNEAGVKLTPNTDTGLCVHVLLPLRNSNEEKPNESV